MRFWHNPPMSVRNGRGLRRYSIIPTLILLSLVSSSHAGARPSVLTLAAGCTTSSPPSGVYSVTVCMSSPSSGATLSGNATVTASVTVTGSAPYVQRVIFYLDGGYLLMDYQSAYSFVLPTGKWVDGSHAIAASAVMHDGFATQRASVPVTFKNGVTTPPVNTNQFHPTSGRTASSGSPFVVAAGGDGASGQTTSGKVSDMITALNPNLFLYLGDVYERGSVTEFLNWYGSSSNYFGRLRAITDPTVGNHEYLTPGAGGYYDYWDNVPKYYSFNANGWHFISLNSNSTYVPTASGSAEYNWLQNDLAGLPSQTCTIVYYHHPLFNIGPQGPATAMSAIWQLMAKYKVDIVLNGHDHDYQRWMPLDGSGSPNAGGIIEFVAGGSGHGLQTFTHSDSRVAYSNDANPAVFGALLLQLNPQGANFNYRNSSGLVLDAGVIPCKPALGDSTPPTTPGGFTATAVASNRVELSWKPSSDNVGVVAYRIMRNGVVIATVRTTFPMSQYKYNDSTVAASSTYQYAIFAYDPAGNHSTTAGPITVTTPTAAFPDLADAYVDASHPSINYGTLNALRVDASPVVHSYVRFSVSGLGGKTITQARLILYAANSSGTGISAVTVENHSWDEKTITYDNAPALGTDLSSTGGFRAANWLTLDVSSYMKGEGIYSFALKTTTSTALPFASKEATSNRPQLLLNLQ